jgi:hypothetical protein
MKMVWTAAALLAATLPLHAQEGGGGKGNAGKKGKGNSSQNNPAPERAFEFLFTQLDGDLDGKVSKTEFLSEFLKRDSTNDKVLVETEFPDLARKRLAIGKKAAATAPEGLIVTFAEFDADSDKKVTKDEYMAIFDRLDTNKDMFLGADELKVTNVPGGAKNKNKAGKGGGE